MWMPYAAAKAGRKVGRMLQLLPGALRGSGSLAIAATTDAALCRQQLQQVTPFAEGATALTAVIVANVACVRVITEIAFPSLFLLLSRCFSVPRARKQHLQHWPSMGPTLGCPGGDLRQFAAGSPGEAARARMCCSGPIRATPVRVRHELPGCRTIRQAYPTGSGAMPRNVLRTPTCSAAVGLIRPEAVRDVDIAADPDGPTRGPSARMLGGSCWIPGW